MPLGQQSPDASIANSIAMRRLGRSVSPADIKEATKPYELDTFVAKGKTDQQLYDTSIQAVIKWWQKQKKAKADAAKESSTSGTGGGTGTSGTSSGSSSGGTSGPSAGGGGGLPNTATGTGSATPASNLQPIRTANELAVRAAAQDREAHAAQMRANAAAAAAAEKQLLLVTAGLENVTVPSYAMTSVANLKAWISQTLAARRRQNTNRGMTQSV